MNAPKYVILAGLLLIVTSEFNTVFGAAPCDRLCRARKTFWNTEAADGRRGRHYRYATCNECTYGLCLPKPSDFTNTACDRDSSDPAVKNNDFWILPSCDKLCDTDRTNLYIECTEAELPVGDPTAIGWYGCRLIAESAEPL